jgi:hypothetical protein
MVRSSVCRRLVEVLIVCGWLVASGPAAAQPASEYAQTLARVTHLLPRQPDKVVVMDADTSGRLFDAKLQHVDGFVIRGERVVYLVRQGKMLQRAIKGAGAFDYVLATVIWHEMAHIDGADEAKAQQAEEDLWTRFVLANRVDSSLGMTYLCFLKKRR